MEPQHRRFLLVPFVVLALVVGCFGLSVRYVEHVRRNLGDAALSYVRFTGPLMSPLTDMRLQLHRIVSVGHSEPSARTSEQRRRVVREALWEFNADFQRYATLAGPGGGPSGAELAEAVTRLNQTCDRVLEQVLEDEGRPPGPLEPDSPRRRLIEASEAVTQLVMRGMAEGAHASTDALVALDEANGRALRLAHTLYGVCGLTALVGGLFAAYAVRKYLRLASLYAELQAGRAKELEQFAGRVAHDILGPLQPVSLGLELLGRKLSADAEATQVLARSQRSLGRVRLIVDGLLRFARAGARPEPGSSVALAQLAEGLREDLEPGAREAGVGLSIEPLPEVAVACSEAALLVVLQNLIRNAVKYIGEGPTKRVVASGSVDAGCVHLEVRDSGPGLPAGMERSGFKPYVRATRTRQPGIGLGLATVKRIVEAHGGRVGVRSAPGAGCAFWVELPLAIC